MKFRMFTENYSGCKVAVNVDKVVQVEDCGGKCTAIHMDGKRSVLVKEDFDTVFSRLNTVADFGR